MAPRWSGRSHPKTSNGWPRRPPSTQCCATSTTSSATRCCAMSRSTVVSSPPASWTDQRRARVTGTSAPPQALCPPENKTPARGRLATGIVDRSEAGTVYVDLGRAEGVMPPEEQIPGEVLHPGRPVLVLILDAQHNPRQAQVRVSRASRMFVHRLLEAEVPEIKAGTVQIRAIAREPGLRTKIAVSSSQAGLDPVGACVGPKGVRHRAILSELASEHVDIVPWSDDAEVFVAAALGPAKPEAVSIDRMTRTATVLVPKAQLSLAIGRDGQNARLAARLTGYRIDIKAAEGEPQSDADATP